MKKPKRPKASDSPALVRATYEARLNLPRSQLPKLDEKAQRTARRAAELTKLREVQALLDVAARAKRDGLTLEQTKAKLRERMKTKSNVELAVTNTMQASYNAGRIAEFLSPATRAEKPFWIYDAMMDLRTSEFCRRCNGVIRPAGDPWFMRRIPPNHHRCRSTIRALRKRYTDMLGGVTTRPPTVQADAGFGRLAGVGWKPNLSGVDRALAKVYRSRR